MTNINSYINQVMTFYWRGISFQNAISIVMALIKSDQKGGLMDEIDQLIADSQEKAKQLRTVHLKPLWQDLTRAWISFENWSQWLINHNDGSTRNLELYMEIRRVSQALRDAMRTLKENEKSKSA